MDNSYFLYTEVGQKLIIERFQICTWEFVHGSPFVEFGCEVSAPSLVGKTDLTLQLYVPWLQDRCTVEDFYNRLKLQENSRFIFNDSISGSTSLDGGININGVIHEFSDRNRLCILPISKFQTVGQRINIIVSLELYHNFLAGKVEKPNIYLRFCISPSNHKSIATIKKGITKSTVLYDIKLNQRRNIPEELLQEVIHRELCQINRCYCFNIIPNSYDLTFFDSVALQNVRTLEYDSFYRYLDDERIKDNELIVIFNKRESVDSYAFFSIYTKEHIGTDQLAIALLISLFSSILLFIPSYKISLGRDTTNEQLFRQMPFLFWFVVSLVITTLAYFAWRKYKK